MPRNDPPVNSKSNTPNVRSGNSSRYSQVLHAGSAKLGAEWIGVSTKKLMQAIGALQANGDACMLGCTTDGGALVFTIFEGPERHKFYWKDSQEADEGLDSIWEAATAGMLPGVRDRIIEITRG